MAERRLTAVDVNDALANRHAKDVFVPECKMGSSWLGCRILDAWAMSKSWSPWTTFGYEIKVDRSDFVNDRKWQEYLPVCHEFYLVCPAKLVAAEELPADVGLLWIVGRSRAICKRKAVRREPEPEKLLRLMAYVLMSRSRVVADMHEANRGDEDARDRWARWLAEDAGEKWLGHMVSRRLAWERDHPRLNVAPRRLDFLPSASELQHEAEDREAAAQSILSRLQTGPATTAELFRLGGSGTSSRIAELRRAGHDIVAGKRTLGKGWLYVLTEVTK